MPLQKVHYLVIQFIFICIVYMPTRVLHLFLLPLDQLFGFCKTAQKQQSSVLHAVFSLRINYNAEIKLLFLLYYNLLET